MGIRRFAINRVGCSSRLLERGHVARVGVFGKYWRSGPFGCTHTAEGYLLARHVLAYLDHGRLLGAGPR
jgi:hypothetical protein